jgi:hypothetical protein
MEDKPSLDYLLLQITEIMEKIKNHRGSISKNFTPEVIDQLDALESSIDILSQHQQSMLKDANIDPDQFIQEKIENPNTSPREKQVLMRAKEIEQDARTFHLALSKAIERKKGKKKTNSDSTKADKKQMKERRKLFKTIGGDKNWIPL